MSKNNSKNSTTIVTGLEEEKFKFTWKLQNLSLVQKDEQLLESQNFEAETGERTPLQSKWIFGFKSKLRDNGTKGYTVYGKLLNIISSNGETEFFCLLRLKLIKPSGSTTGNFRTRGRVKINDIVFLGNTWSTSESWDGYEDEFGAVTFLIELSLLKPLNSGVNVKAIEQDFQLKSADMAKRNLASLLVADSIDFDVKIMCSDEKEFKCHKRIVNSHSPVFKTMLQSEYYAEAKTGIINVKDISGKTMEVLLQYFYTGDLSKFWSEPDVIVEFTYAVGKYQLLEVLEFLDKMLGYMGEDPPTAFALLDLANKLDLKKAESQLKDKIIKFTISSSTSELLSVYGS